MSTPSRRSEIRRRRTRTEKISQLRKRYAAAKTEGERTKLTEKLKKVSLGLTVEHFAKAPATRKAR
jgi:hypothetical protein